MFKQGDKVKLANPEAGEENAEYIVAEWNADRGFIRFVCNMAIAPVELVRECDIVLA